MATRYQVSRADISASQSSKICISRVEVTALMVQTRYRVARVDASATITATRYRVSHAVFFADQQANLRLWDGTSVKRVKMGQWNGTSVTYV